jgi:hypothetical protein
MRGAALLGAGLLLLGSAGGCALAEHSEPPVQLGAVRSSIVGGAPTTAGAWPAVAWADVGCTATLVHPQVMLYAGHCGTDLPGFWLGDGFDVHVDEATQTLEPRHSEEERFVASAECRSYPHGSVGGGDDLAYCLLSEPLSDVPPLLPIGACERRALVVGASATLVGYGFEGDGRSGLGIKREVVTSVSELGPELVIGDALAGTCDGDSGGPALVNASNPQGAANWRLLGVLSSGLDGECGVGYYTDVSAFVEWLETETGYRFTPGIPPASSGCGDPPPSTPPDAASISSGGCGLMPSSGRPHAWLLALVVLLLRVTKKRWAVMCVHHGPSDG